MKTTILRFAPYLKTVIWGGDKICTYKGIEQTEPNIGESWEISAVPGHESVVSEGKFEGMSLTDLISRFGAELLGSSVFRRYSGNFPLLIKLIDACDNLSVQVHPDDALARRRHGSLGKTEMWYIVDAEPGAKIYAGLNRKITPEEYVELVEADRFQTVLAEHDAAAGDLFFLPAGRVHAIGAGNLLAEIQESSDITYRIYDYGRRDADGNTRELHTEMAKDAIDFNVYSDYKSPRVSDEEKDTMLVDCEHFHTRRLILDGRVTLTHDDRSFTVMMCISGSAVISCEGGETVISKGQTVLIPASLYSVTLTGRATLLLSRS